MFNGHRGEQDKLANFTTADRLISRGFSDPLPYKVPPWLPILRVGGHRCEKISEGATLAKNAYYGEVGDGSSPLNDLITSGTIIAASTPAIIAASRIIWLSAGT